MNRPEGGTALTTAIGFPIVQALVVASLPNASRLRRSGSDWETRGNVAKQRRLQA
jgi:hypothetical protein